MSIQWMMNEEDYKDKSSEEKEKIERLNRKKSRYIREGIVRDINVSVEEEHNITRLGSSDRKGYTLKLTATYLEESYTAYLVIEPFYSQERTDRAIKKAEEDVRQSFALRIYNDLFKLDEDII